MKTALSLLLALVMCLSLCACSENDDTTMNNHQIDNQMNTNNSSQYIDIWETEPSGTQTTTDIKQNAIVGAWYTGIISDQCMAISFNNDSTFSATSVYYSRYDDLIIYDLNGIYDLNDDALSLIYEDMSDSFSITIADDHMSWYVDGLNEFQRVPENTTIQGEWRLFNAGEEIRLNFGGRRCPIETLNLYKDGTYTIKDSSEKVTNRGKYSIINDNTTLSLDDYFYFTYVLHESSILELKLAQDDPLILIRQQ